MLVTIAGLVIFGVMAAAGVPAAPPDLTGIAAIITAIIGVFGFFATLVRGKANNERVGEIEDAANYAHTISEMTESLRQEVIEIKAAQREEREQWEQARIILESQIDKLRAELHEQVAENYKLRLEISRLREQLSRYVSQEELDAITKNP